MRVNLRSIVGFAVMAFAVILSAGCGSSESGADVPAIATVPPASTTAPSDASGDASESTSDTRSTATPDQDAEPPSDEATTTEDSAPDAESTGPGVSPTADIADGDAAGAVIALSADAVALPGVPSTIEILTPSSGGGIRPDLAWEPVDGAATYELIVFTPLDKPYWAWSGPETSVPLGGAPRLGPNSAGAALIADMRWFVVAFDVDGWPLAQSLIVRISP